MYIELKEKWSNWPWWKKLLLGLPLLLVLIGVGVAYLVSSPREIKKHPAEKEVETLYKEKQEELDRHIEQLETERLKLESEINSLEKERLVHQEESRVIRREIKDSKDMDDLRKIHKKLLKK